MGNFFGGHKKSRVTEQDKAVLQLKQQRDKMKMYQRKIEASLVKERELAKKLLKDGKKEKAKLLLKKKRFQESLLTKTDNQLDNLEKMTSEIEFAQIEHQVIDGLKVGNDCLKKMHQMMSLDDVEKIMDETRDGIEYQNEIDELLAGGLTEEDEEAVLAELSQITGEAEIAEITLPTVPQDELPEVDESEKQREKERRQERKEPELVPAS